MTEFKIHHDVSELLKLLGARDDAETEGAEAYADLLVKSIAPNVTSQVSIHQQVKKLSEKSKSEAEFTALYEDLKGKSIQDLSAFIYMLTKISDNHKLKSFLERHALSRASSVSKKSTTDPLRVNTGAESKMPAEEVAQVKDLLKNVTTNQGILNKRTEIIPQSPTGRDKFILKKQNRVPLPVMPAWVTERPYLTLDFVGELNDRQILNTLDKIPPASQERILVQDLLYCMSGIDGDYITNKPLIGKNSTRQFQTDEDVDSSLQELVKRILPLCANFSTVARFIEEKSLFGVGMVNNALAAAMRNLVKDYFVFIAQLEHQNNQGLLTLQNLWFHVQPTLKTMDILASIANTVNKGELTGGAVLRILHEKTISFSGEPLAQDLCVYLTQSACVPYFEILEKWIYRGIISDPYSEFMVEDNEVLQKEDTPMDYSDDYWEKRYYICKERVPVFLEKCDNMIMRTGKYLSVIREYGQDVKFPDANPITYTLKEKQYIEQIERSYTYASQKLKDLLITECDLLGRLRSVKHYFLMDQGDFIVQFLDMADEELRKNVGMIIPTRLESLLELALRTSVANNDPYKDDVSVELLPNDLLSQMFKILRVEDTKRKKDDKGLAELHRSGHEAFTFVYDVKWPLSLVLSRKTLACYQFLFRHLLYWKHVERQLCSVWMSTKVAKCFPQNASQWYAGSFALRQRMLNFTQNLEYYMTFEVIEPNWQEFITKMNTVSDVDDILRYHGDFLDACLKDCMLTMPDLLEIVHRLSAICVSFCTFILDHCHLDNSSISSTTSCGTAPVAGTLSFEQEIERYDKEFTQTLVELLDRISDQTKENDNEKLPAMLYRLDFNGFYNAQLETLAMDRSVFETTRPDMAGDESVSG